MKPTQLTTLLLLLLLLASPAIFAKTYGEMKFAELKARATQGDTTAMNVLGNRYATDKRDKSNRAKAIELYKKSVEKGDPDAQYLLEILYLESPNKAERKKAVSFVYKKAMQGDGRAQVLLAVMYFSGKGVKANKTTGIKWINKPEAIKVLKESAAKGNKDAKEILKLAEALSKKK